MALSRRSPQALGNPWKTRRGHLWTLPSHRGGIRGIQQAEPLILGR
jgi:hypothetical protein